MSDVDLLKATKVAAGKVKKSGQKGGDETEKRAKRRPAAVQDTQKAKRMKQEVAKSEPANELRESSDPNNLNPLHDLITSGADELSNPEDLNLDVQNHPIDLRSSTGRVNEPGPDSVPIASLIGEENWLNDRVLDEACDRTPVTDDRFLWVPTGLTSSFANLSAFIKRHLKSATKFILVVLNSVDNSIG